MMPVFLEADNVITSLGFSSAENFRAMESGVSGIRISDDPELSPVPIPVSSIDNDQLGLECQAFSAGLTRFDRLMLLSAHKALASSATDPSQPRTVFILSTTKGNVDQLVEQGKNAGNPELYLWHSGDLLRSHFRNPNPAIVISNACISGLLAMIVGMRLIRNGNFNQAVITGVDVLSRFIVSGFQSFLSLSPSPCRPFDRDRDGLTLGEGAGTVILTNARPQNDGPVIEMAGGSVSNDANHISGPSRTGEGLYLALKQLPGIQEEMSGFISAHGTATPYNDDMESMAITRAGLQEVPVNSLKGFIGHTLGAAGTIETILGACCLEKNVILKTMGVQVPGLAQPLDIVDENRNIPLRSFVKTASGFGGCNAAALFIKHD